MGLGYKNAKDLYIETEKKITKSPKEWISFLNTSTWMFEYSFGEQVLIYAQRPNARACAEMSDWNEKLNRWVRKHSTGITILKYKDGETYLTNIFDIVF